MESAGLAIHPCQVAGCPAVVIEFPPAVGMTECRFSAVVLLHKEPPAEGTKPRTCYYTLEKTAAGSKGVICSWEMAGATPGEGRMHANTGRLVEPTLEAFGRALRPLIEQRLEVA